MRMTKTTNLLLASLTAALACAPVSAQTVPGGTYHFPPDTRRWQDAVSGKDYVANELLVAFAPELFSVPTDNPAALTLEQVTQLHAELKAAALALAQGRGYQVLDTSPFVLVALMRLPAGMSPLTAAVAVQSDPRVAFAEPNRISTVAESPTDPCWSDSANPCFSLQNGHFTDVGAQRGWDAPVMDYTLKIAVLDTGFHFEHPDKWVHLSTTEDHDFVFPSYSYALCVAPLLWAPRDWDGAGYDSDALQLMDLDPSVPFNPLCPLAPSASGSHGTKVTGTIASAWNNGEGGVGTIGGPLLVDPGSPAVIVPIQVMDVRGNGTAYDIAQGVGYASGFWVSDGHGAFLRMATRVDIANMSYGSQFTSFYEVFATALADANGVLLIAAAGNNASALPFFPAGFPWVVSVSNFDVDEDLASSSNFGKVDLTAPGVNIYTTSYDYSSCPALPFFPCLGATGGVPSYGLASGTSLSAPHVTGIAALYKANHDSATNAQLRAMLLSFAADRGAPGPDIQFGSGLVQAAPGRGAKLVSTRGPKLAYLVSTTNASVRTAPVAAITGNFQFLNVPAGSYFLLAAADADEDGIYAETGEAVGASGGSGALQDAQARFWPGGNLFGTLNFTLDWPGVEQEPANDTFAGAGATFVGFYAEATYSGAGDTDWLRFRVPADGFYRIWTEGRNTIECREDSNEMDPRISLYLDGGLAMPILLATNSTNAAGGNCAEIPSFWLERAKPYYVEVTSEGAAPVVGFATILHVDGP